MNIVQSTSSRSAWLVPAAVAAVLVVTESTRGATGVTLCVIGLFSLFTGTAEVCRGVGPTEPRHESVTRRPRAVFTELVL